MSTADASSVDTEMSPEIEEQIVRWTARLAVAAYLVRLAADTVGWRDNQVWCSCRERIVRYVWTAGCVCFLLHVAAAFQFVHSWSHHAAAEHTAHQTEAVTGWRWQGGIWVNYVFTVWWPLDVLYGWRRGLDRIPRGYRIALHCVVGFLMLNATVVFGPSGWRWITGVFVILLGCTILHTRRRVSHT